MKSDRIEKILIVGDGISAWISAAILANGLAEHDVEINVLASVTRTKPINPLAESTLPPSNRFHKILGINEKDLMAKCNGTFKLGVRYCHWRNQNQEGLQLFGGFQSGAPVALHHIANKLRRSGHEINYTDFSLAGIAARENRFVHPSSDTQSIYSSIAYGMHLDGLRYLEYLREYSESKGVRCFKGEIENIECSVSTGFLQQIKLRDGHKLKADFFIDASGNEAKLIGDVCQIGLESWAHYLPCNTGFRLQSKVDKCKLLTLIKGEPFGWSKAVPLKEYTEHIVVGVDSIMPDSKLMDLVNNKVNAGGSAIDILNFKSGVRKKLWQHNCLAVGAAAVSLDPLVISESFLTQSAVFRWLDYFPTKKCSPFLQQEYNRITVEESKRARDFHCAHYLLRDDVESKFAQVCRNLIMSVDLKWKLDLFISRGRIAFFEEEIIRGDTWADFFLALDLWPKRYDPYTDKFSENQLMEWHDSVTTTVQAAVNSMPVHEDYLQNYI